MFMLASAVARRVMRLGIFFCRGAAAAPFSCWSLLLPDAGRWRGFHGNRSIALEIERCATC